MGAPVSLAESVALKVAAPRTLKTVVQRRKLSLKVKFESSLSYFSFKR